jgi:hypothetical protein
MGSKEFVDINDVMRASAALGAAVAAAGLLYSGFDGLPGFVWGCLASLAAGAAEHIRRMSAGRAAADALGTLSRSYVKLAIGTVLLSFVGPAMVPASTFAEHAWIIRADGVAMVCGLTAVPMAHVTLAMAKAAVRRRTKRQ